MLNMEGFVLLDLCQRINRDVTNVGKLKSDRKYSITFIGFGDAAQESFKQILNHASDTFLSLENIFIFSHQEKDVSLGDRKRVGIEKLIKDSKSTNARLTIVPYEGYGEMTRVLDEHPYNLVLVTADANPAFFKDRLTVGGKSPEDIREELTRKNLKIIEDIQGYFSKDFSGIVAMVTNQPEILAYKLAAESNCPAHRIIAVNPDKRRLDYVLPLSCERLQDEHLRDSIIDILCTDAFLIGYHGDSWPVCTHTNVRVLKDSVGGLLEDFIGFYINHETQKLIYDLQKKYVEEITWLSAREKGLETREDIERFINELDKIKEPKIKKLVKDKLPTLHSTSLAIVDTAAAYICEHVFNQLGGTDIFLNNSILYDHNGKALYAQLPMHFFYGIPQAVDRWIERLNQPRDGNALDEILDSLLKKIDKLRREGEIQGEELKIDEETLRKDIEKQKGLFNGYSTPKIRIYSSKDRENIETVVDSPLQNVHGTVYYITNQEPLLVHAVDFPEADLNNERKFRVKINDDRYNSKVTLRKIFLADKKVFVEGLYADKSEKRSHWTWFDAATVQSNGFIPALASANFATAANDDASLLYAYSGLEDTCAYYNGKLYLIVEQQQKVRVIAFDPQDPNKFQVIRDGVPHEENVISVTAVQDDLIFATDKNFYKLHKDRLKKVCHAECPPTYIRSIPNERIVLYSDREHQRMYALTLDAVDKTVPFDDGPIFSVFQDHDILLASIFNHRTQLSRYGGIKDFMSHKNKEGYPKYSAPIEQLKKVIIPHPSMVFAFSNLQDGTLIHPLSVYTLQERCNPIMLPHASCLRLEWGQK